jgi:aerobic-type carbon monoxide dehydrogenase small subunit (CoxS/CutS family)
LKQNVRFRLNGKPVALVTEDDRTLLWVLRGDLDLTGTKYGCGERTGVRMFRLPMTPARVKAAMTA